LRANRFRGGDFVIFHQDEEDPENWFIEKAAKGKGWEVRIKEEVQSGVLFNNSKLAREIAASVAYTKPSGRMLVAGKPTKFEKRILWGLLTNNLRN